MRITEAIYNILDRHTPMTEMDRTELRNDAQLDYLEIKKSIIKEGRGRVLKDGVDPKKFTWKQKMVYWAEYWPVRTAIALVYIFLLRIIEDWVNPTKEEPEYEEVD